MMPSRQSWESFAVETTVFLLICAVALKSSLDKFCQISRICKFSSNKLSIELTNFNPGDGQLKLYLHLQVSNSR